MTAPPTDTDPLPSWRPGPVRDAVVGFLDAVVEVDPARRVAVFDNDGTIWCERPSYAQFDFLRHGLAGAVGRSPELGERPEYRAVLDGDRAALADLGLARVAMALTEVFADITPEDFDREVRAFFADARNPVLDRPLRDLLYVPMLELVDALRARGVTVCIVTGGGTEFVRAVSLDLYDVPPERVVGTMIRYRYERRDGRPVLLRTAELDGPANEGSAKIEAIQHHLGRRPLLAAGNSLGDREMLELVAADSPSLALLVDHDDAEREFAYASEAGTIADAEPITDIGRRSGWVVVSMQRDWETVFRAEQRPG